MPRNTSELAAKMAGNKFDLVLIASVRVRELRNGHAPKIVTTSTDCVTAITEIEQGFIGRDYLRKVK